MAASDNAGERAAQAAEPSQAVTLPQTATGFAGTVAEGLAMLLAGIGGLRLTRRRAA